MEKHLILLLYIIQKRYQIKNAGKELSIRLLHFQYSGKRDICCSHHNLRADRQKGREPILLHRDKPESGFQ